MSYGWGWCLECKDYSKIEEPSGSLSCDHDSKHIDEVNHYYFHTDDSFEKYLRQKLSCLSCLPEWVESSKSLPHLEGVSLASHYPAPDVYKESVSEDFDAVQRPKHYNMGEIEVFDFIRDQNLNFPLGNVVKYVARAGKKDPSKLIEDLDKAMWYLRREIEELRKGK